MNGRVQAVERSIDILASLAGGPRNLTEIARVTNLSKATAFRLLASLGHRSLVVKDSSTNQYMLGPGCLQLLEGVMSGLGAVAASGRSILQRLVQETGETVTIHIKLGNQRVCIEEIPSPQPIRYTSSVGATAPLHVGAAGKVLMAFMDEAERTKALRGLSLEAMKPDTIVDRDALVPELHLVRRQGYATSQGERIPGAAAISVPVQAGDMHAVLSILGPESRLPKRRLLELLPVLRKAAAELEATFSSQEAPAKVAEA